MIATPPASPGSAAGRIVGSWADPEQRLEWLLRVAAVMYLTHLVDGGALELALPLGAEVAVRGVLWGLMLLGAVFGGRVLRRPVVWITVGCCFFLITAVHADMVGNHHWVLGYLAFVLALACDARAERMLAVVATNLRFMLVVIMSFAALQKLVDPEFRGGFSIAFLFATGKLFGPVLELCDSCWQAVTANQATLAGAGYPARTAPVTLVPPLPMQAAVVYGFTALTIGIEALLAGLFAFVGNPVVRLGALWLFIAVLGFTRPEYVFASFLALSGLWLSPDDPRLLRTGFLTAFVLLAAAGFAL